nr:hypothetical protein [Acinetobacter sp. Marseille-Q1620]
MDNSISLRYQSELSASRQQIWQWITSVEGISKEISPYFRMTAPKNIRSINDLQPEAGKKLFRSYIFLFGFLPIDYSDMTLVKLEPEQGFIENSPMGSMKNWQHIRSIIPSHTTNKLLLVDELTFEPHFAKPLVVWFIKKVFKHRHSILQKHLNIS